MEEAFRIEDTDETTKAVESVEWVEAVRVLEVWQVTSSPGILKGKGYLI